MLEPEKGSEQLGEVVTTGMWGNVPWRFIASSQEPDPRLCDAAFCIITYQGKVILTEHKTRGYEFTGGHIESGENAITAVVREAREEGSAVINAPLFFGYKKVSPPTPVPHRDDPSRYYPFPHSYVPYYFAVATRIVEDAELPADIASIRLASYVESLELLRTDQNHDKILSHLVTNGLIVLE